MNDLAVPADRAAPHFHETVLAGLPEAVIVADRDGRITFVNAAAEALFGYGGDEAVGEPITLLMPRQTERRVDVVKWLARWSAEPDLEQSRFLDLAARRKDGGEILIDVRVREGRIGGEPRYFITARDDTTLRREQRLLKGETLRAARILLVAEDAIVSIDEAQTIVFFNLAAERMFGYTVEEALGQPLTMLLPLKSRLDHARHIEAFRNSRQASKMMSERTEVRGRRRSGEEFPVEAALTKVRAAGQLTYTAHLRDVTERNRARDGLMESERQIRAVFDHVGEAVALLTTDGQVLQINRAGAALATTDRPLVGAPLWEAPWHGVDLAAAPAAAEPLKAAIRAAASGQSVNLAVELSRNGAPLPVEVRLTPIEDAAGRVVYVLAEGRFGA